MASSWATDVLSTCDDVHGLLGQARFQFACCPIQIHELNLKDIGISGDTDLLTLFLGINRPF